MNIHADKSGNSNTIASANTVSGKSGNGLAAELPDVGTGTMEAGHLQQMADGSSQIKQLQFYTAIANNSPRVVQQKAYQDIVNSRSTVAQRKVLEAPGSIKNNDTGLSDNLKEGVERLSGFSMDDVKVHYNSGKPAQLQAHAYAQGTEIHVAPGQEKHLPHEAWHVVQQKQGRVQPSAQLKPAGPVNTDPDLEQEADRMGEKARTVLPADQAVGAAQSPYVNWVRNHSHGYSISSEGVIQGVFDIDTITGDIVNHATAIRSAGGTTNEAFIIRTNGEHPQIFIKFTASDFSVEAARLARLFHIDTPQAIEINKAAISAKIRTLNSGIADILASKAHAIAFEFVDGQKVTHRSKGQFNENSYRQVGAIAAFDMLIGKTDLFENFEQYGGDDQENYNNVLVRGSNLTDIDFAPGNTGNTRVSFRYGLRADIVAQIIADPATIHDFVSGQIGGLFELGNDRENFLQIQKGILEMVAQVDAREAENVSDRGVQEMITAYARMADGARGAIATVDGAILAHRDQVRLRLETQRAREREEQARRIAAEQERLAQAQSSCGCYLTTACCYYFGLADDCLYLTVLRDFRDNWLLKQRGGEELVNEYYEKAPLLVKSIGRRRDEEEIYLLLLKGIQMAVDLIQQQQMERACIFYQKMSRSLENLLAA